MKKLILTSPAFSGEVEVLYDIEGKLVLLDIQNSNMSEAQVKYLKEHLPVKYNGQKELNVALNSKTLSIIELDFEVTFDMFYDDYIKKRNPHRVKPLWDKMSKAARLRAYANSKAYKRYCQNNPWYTPLDPESYLKRKEYLNDWK